jgi:membrane protein DedA with SNARE-associated domain
MDLMALVGPLMTSPVLYPTMTLLTALDGVLPMIPSEAIVLAAGVFAHATAPSLLLVVLSAGLGAFLGDHLAYAVARSVFGPRLIGRSKHLSRAVAAAERQLQRRGGPLIVASRFLPGGRITMNAACGTTRYPLARFTPASALAALAWATYTAGLGFLGGAAFVANPLLGLAVGLGLSLAMGAVIELIRRRSTALPKPKRQAKPAGSTRRTPSPESPYRSTTIARSVAKDRTLDAAALRPTV